MCFSQCPHWTHIKCWSESMLVYLLLLFLVKQPHAFTSTDKDSFSTSSLFCTFEKKNKKKKRKTSQRVICIRKPPLLRHACACACVWVRVFLCVCAVQRPSPSLSRPLSLSLSLSLAPSTPLTALHSNCVVCEWVCVGAVVLIGEVSKLLGGLYNNCDKVESLFLIVVQSCRVIFLLQQSVGGFMLSVHPKHFSFFSFSLRKVTLASSAFHLSLSVAIALWKQFSHALFIQWGQPLEMKVRLQILGPETDAFLSLSFVTVVFCKWQCWVITCVKNQAGRGH